MLIWIDSSVLTANLATDLDACLGISTIFDAVFRGEHYALGPRSTLGALAVNANLSPLTKSVISRIHANLPTIGSITSLISSRIEVTYGKSKTIVHRRPSEWEVPLAEIGKLCARKSVLLAESLEDSRAFVHAAKQYQVAKRLNGQVNLECYQGGGSTIPSVFKNIVSRENRWCLCITDSDRLCPEDKMCDSADKCRKIAEGEEIVASHVDIKAREIENILPFAFIGEVMPPTHQSQWDWHKDRFYKLRSDAHSYCDMKLGTHLKKFCVQPPESPKRKYWVSVAIDLTRASALTAQCDKAFQCGHEEVENCNSYVTKGFGDRLLGLMLENLDGRSTHDSERRTRNDPNRQVWMNIGQLVFEWGCAPMPTRL